MTLDAETATAGGPAAVARPTSARERFERIYRILRDRICLLEYAPGSHLSEEELAQEFEISRTPVRRVLARLESEGLVQSVHGVGTIVTDVDIEELQQVYHLRMELAELIGKLCPIVRAPPRACSKATPLSAEKAANRSSHRSRAGPSGRL